MCVMGVVFFPRGFRFGCDNDIKVGEESMVYFLNQLDKPEDKSEDTSPSLITTANVQFHKVHKPQVL